MGHSPRKSRSTAFGRGCKAKLSCSGPTAITPPKGGGAFGALPPAASGGRFASARATAPANSKALGKKGPYPFCLRRGRVPHAARRCSERVRTFSSYPHRRPREPPRWARRLHINTREPPRWARRLASHSAHGGPRAPRTRLRTGGAAADCSGSMLRAVRPNPRRPCPNRVFPQPPSTPPGSPPFSLRNGSWRRSLGENFRRKQRPQTPTGRA